LRKVKSKSSFTNYLYVLSPSKVQKNSLHLAHLAHLGKPLSYIIFKGVVYDTSANGLAFIQPPPPPYILIAQSLHFDWSKYRLWLVKM